MSDGPKRRHDDLEEPALCTTSRSEVLRLAVLRTGFVSVTSTKCLRTLGADAR